MPPINWFAAIVAGILGFFPGAIWYSKAMFLRAWKADVGAEGASEKVPEGIRIGIGLLLSLVAAIAFALILGPQPPLQLSILFGLGAGIAFVTTSFGIQYLFEGRTIRLTLINGGYHTVQFLIFGLILGLWH